VSKKCRVVNEDYVNEVNEANELNDSVWIQIHGATLKSSDNLMLLSLMTELLILCKKMVVAQFPLLKGLQSTLIQYHLGW